LRRNCVDLALAYKQGTGLAGSHGPRAGRTRTAPDTPVPAPPACPGPGCQPRQAVADGTQLGLGPDPSSAAGWPAIRPPYSLRYTVATHRPGHAAVGRVARSGPQAPAVRRLPRPVTSVTAMQSRLIQERLVRMLERIHSGNEPRTESDELIRLVAASLTLLTRHAVDDKGRCRRCCGSRGWSRRAQRCNVVVTLNFFLREPMDAIHQQASELVHIAHADHGRNERT